MAFDAATNQLVLFGGANTDSTGIFADTWTWGDRRWHRQHPVTSPPARTFATMAFDAATAQLILFGGYDNAGLSDTWAWTGSNWIKQSPSTSPARRWAASMAYDEATGQLVLFGGVTSGSSPAADTWTWDGSTWTRVRPGRHPSARYLASMTFDPRSNELLLFGGNNSNGGVLQPGTWRWDGTTWTATATAAGPPLRYGALLAYDGTHSMLFGGNDGRTSAADDEWTWEHGTWRQRHPNITPPGRFAASMAWDPRSDQVILFGGLDDHGLPLDDTWSLGP